MGKVIILNHVAKTFNINFTKRVNAYEYVAFYFLILRVFMVFLAFVLFYIIMWKSLAFLKSVLFSYIEKKIKKIVKIL